MNARTKQTTLHLAVEMENHEVLSVVLEGRQTNIHKVNDASK
jgi:hypothetical protein